MRGCDFFVAWPSSLLVFGVGPLFLHVRSQSDFFVVWIPPLVLEMIPASLPVSV